MTPLAPLFNPALTFSAAAQSLRAALPGTDEFHFLFRLHDFVTSPDPVKDLSLPSSFSHHEWVAARMKAEWCLWEGYAKWDFALNPFLGHFVEVWEARYAGQTGFDTVVVGIILSGQAKELANMTCEEIQANAPSLEILEGAISMQKLQLALLQQEYAPNHPLFSNSPTPKTPNAEFTGGASDFGSDKVTIGDGASIQGGFSLPSSPAPMSRSSSLNPSAFEREHYVRQILSKGLEKASCTALTAEESSTLSEMIQKYPDTTIELFEPDIQSFAGTIEFNPIIFRDRMLPLLLSSPLSEESPPSFFPPTLPVLETLSLLITANPQLLHNSDSQSSRLVHDFLANAGRQLEALSAKEGERDKTSRQVRLVRPPKAAVLM